MKSIDALYNLMAKGLFIQSSQSHVPGYIVQHASPEEKKALSQLTSEDLLQLRVEKDHIPTNKIYNERKYISTLLLQFDKKLKL